MRAAGFVLAGVAAGLFSGALGVGGAIVATPLIRFLGVSPYLAIGTTVPVMLPTTLTGAWTYGRAGLIDLRAVAWTAVASVPAVVAGAASTRHVNGHLLMMATASVLLALALRLRSQPEEGGGRPARGSVLSLVVVGLVAGFFSGLLGLGGGFLLVPVYFRTLRFPLKVALGTSLAAIAVTTVPNMVAQGVVGNVDWTVALLLALGVVPGARAGSLLAIRAPERGLRLALTVCLVGVGAVYAFAEATALFSS